MSSGVQSQQQPAAADKGEQNSEKENVQESKETQPTEQRFIQPQPLREDQVQNAVNFLSHPKVKGSPIVYRRSFLERKGLTKDEIDEAFRRVPDPPSDNTNAAAIPDLQYKPPAAQVQAAPKVQEQAKQVEGPIIVRSQVSRPARWSQVIFTIGLLGATGAGAAILTRNYLLPKFKAWIRRIVFEEDNELEPNHHRKQKLSIVEASTAASNAALSAAVAELTALTKEMMAFRTGEHKYFEVMLKSMEVQTDEIKSTLASFRETILSIERTPKESLNHHKLHQLPNGDHKEAEYAASSRGALLLGTKVEDEKVLSGMEKVVTQSSINRPASTPPKAASDTAPHSSSYMEVLAMLERGEKPPGIREINDKPPIANQTPSNSQLQPVTKPWESPEVTNVVSQPPSSSMPWWRSKQVDESVRKWPIESSVKITEVDAGASTKPSGQYMSYPSVANEESRSTRAPPYAVSNPMGREVRQAWVPPPRPKTIMPGADVAIRQPKGKAFTSLSNASREEPELGSGSSSSTMEDDVVANHVDGSEGGASFAEKVSSSVKNVTDGPSYKDVVVKNEGEPSDIVRLMPGADVAIRQPKGKPFTSLSNGSNFRDENFIRDEPELGSGSSSSNMEEVVTNHIDGSEGVRFAERALSSVKNVYDGPSYKEVVVKNDGEPNELVRTDEA